MNKQNLLFTLIIEDFHFLIFSEVLFWKRHYMNLASGCATKAISIIA